MRAKTDAAIYRPDLGQAVMEYAEGPTTGFIGLQVMPIKKVLEKSGSFPVIPKEHLLKVPDVSRAPRGKYNRGDWDYERGQYTTKEKGWEEPVDESERAQMDAEAPGMADFIATQRAWNHIMRAQEKRIADKIFNATNFTANAVTNEWDDATNATPIDDVNTGMLSVRSACGMLPNTLIVAYSTFINVISCDQVIDRLKYTFPGIDLNRMTSAHLSSIFNVPNVLIGGGVYDSAKPGLAASISDLWSNEYAMLTIVNNGMDITSPCIGRTFLWTADSPQNPVVEQYQEVQTRSDIYRVRHHVDECLLKSVDEDGTEVSDIAQAVSYLFSNITT